MTAVAVDGRTMRVSSLERVLWPLTGTTKGELLDYYRQVAHVLLPHIATRPLTLHRFPTGVDGPHFYQTRTPPHPDWLRTVRLHFARTGKTFDAPVIDDLAGLVWAANLTAIELHPFLHSADRPGSPLVLVFDLDPGPPAELIAAAETALWVRALLEAVGLASYPKTSGAAGLHVYVPLGDPIGYDATKAFARTLAERLARDQPGRVVVRMAKSLRAGKVFLDWSQNDPGKSTVAPYSMRGLRVPTVSTPVTWPEVEAAVAAGEPRRLAFGPADVLRRIDTHGDLFAPVLTSRQALPG